MLNSSAYLRHGKTIFGAALVAVSLVSFSTPAHANEYGSRYEDRAGRFGELDWSRHPDRRPAEQPQQKEVIIYNSNAPGMAGTTTIISPPTVIAPGVGTSYHVPADSTVITQTAMIRPVKFHPDDRATISNYMQSRYWNSCPQGKIQNYPECAPHFRITRYHVGNTLPESLLVSTLPQELSARISAPPQGFFYVHDKGNVFLIQQGTNQIFDIVPLSVRMRVN